MTLPRKTWRFLAHRIGRLRDRASVLFTVFAAFAVLSAMGNHALGVTVLWIALCAASLFVRFDRIAGWCDERGWK